jgi:hypothetical protein
VPKYSLIVEKCHISQFVVESSFEYLLLVVSIMQMKRTGRRFIGLNLELHGNN